MKKLKLTKFISGSLLIASIFVLSPIGVSAEWKQDSNGWWYADGASWYTGWKQIDGNWYYFYNNGYMAHDTVIDGLYLNSSGAYSTNSTENTNLDPNLNQYLMNSDELKQSFQNYINSSQQSSTSTSPSNDEQSSTSSSTIAFLESQKKVAQDTIDSCERLLNNPKCMETLKPSLRQTISKCENTIDIINQKENKLRN
jgi:hypothetical protein